MRTIAPLLVLSALGACAAGTVTNAQAGRVSASVAQSEWTRSGFVDLDLGTGRYRLTHQPSRGSPNAPVPTTRGRLAPAELQPLRAAYAAARAEGLTVPACRDGGRPPNIVVSNGGPRQLVLDDGERRLSTHGELGCWSEAANRLAQRLEATFGHRARSPR